MTSAIGWYGPLIDLSEASLHVGDFVQLLVFVHRSTPTVQYKLSKGGGGDQVIRTEIQVGDNTRPFFPVSLWHKQMQLSTPGDVILLQNVKIAKFGDFVEARTVQCSSLQRLIHPHGSLLSKGIDDLIANCRVGTTTKEKLRKVVEWLQRSGSTLCNLNLYSDQKKGHFLRNWKVREETKSRDCYSLSEVSRLSNSCEAVFHASVGEIFLPFTQQPLGDSKKEKMFISRRLYKTGDTSLVEDLICTGCQLCGSPLDLEYSCMYGMNQNTCPYLSGTRLQKSCLETLGLKGSTYAIERKSTIGSLFQKMFTRTGIFALESQITPKLLLDFQVLFHQIQR
ncbi:uncharacterized protein LOC142618439 isoform X2 [Castanea sativa]|uniref:uncharacterized protein LOC142618439 isoform X2 n=1 Tax=Castanea sativa TaxID=21020 RepID=UPI003F651BCC